MEKYWKERLAQTANNQYNKSNKVMKELNRVYEKALKQIEVDIQELMREDELSSLNAYKYQRQKQLQEQIIQQMNIIGKVEVTALQVTLYDSYFECAKATAAILGKEFDTLLLSDAAKKAVEQGWLGSNFSNRIWKNKEKLLNRLNKMIVDNIVLGKSKDEFIKDLIYNMGVGFSDADRLVRTELMNIINQAQKDSYTKAGYREYELLAASDNRTCGVCSSLNGSKYYFAEAVVGSNYPPLHPRCRTTAIPIID